ncbi:hypothetical protein Tco_1117351 [Tanacetum coccineum]
MQKFPDLEKGNYEIYGNEDGVLDTGKLIIIFRGFVQHGKVKEALPEDHMLDFHHYDDARDIWMAVKARFGGNEESKKMRKTMLKQQFTEFSVTEEEGLHKGYDRFQKILSQLNQVQARPDNDDINLNYGVKAAAAPTHSAFIGAASSGSKLNYSNQQNIVPSVSQTSGRSDNITKCVLHSFVTEVKTDEPKALVSVDSMVNWSDHATEYKTSEVEKVYGMMAGLYADKGGAGVSDAASEFAMMGISPKIVQ